MRYPSLMPADTGTSGATAEATPTIQWHPCNCNDGQWEGENVWKCNRPQDFDINCNTCHCQTYGD